MKHNICPFLSGCNELQTIPSHNDHIHFYEESTVLPHQHVFGFKQQNKQTNKNAICLRKKVNESEEIRIIKTPILNSVEK